jgi:hypothetical protein
VPFLGQAIDAYDTVESCLTLYRSETPDAKEDAEFDLVLALVGWIPGPGDGVKKSLRLVNRDPQRFAPVLFDLLRFILSECGIKTSPEMLLEQMFDAAALGSEIDEVMTGVKSSSTFKALPNWTKIAVTTVLADARDNMPRMMGVVEKRLLKWKKVQRNSSAAPNGSERPATVKKPGGRDAQVGTEGHDGASRTHPKQLEGLSIRPTSCQGKGLLRGLYLFSNNLVCDVAVARAARILRTLKPTPISIWFSKIARKS